MCRHEQIVEGSAPVLAKFRKKFRPETPRRSHDPRRTQRGSAATERNKKRVDKRMEEAAAGLGFHHRLVPHFLVDVF